MTENEDIQERIDTEAELARLRHKETVLTWVCYASAVPTWAFLQFGIGFVAAFVSVIITLSAGIAAHVLGKRAQRLEDLLSPTQGRCKNCDYDLTGLDRVNRCPECGTLIVHPPGAELR